MQKLECDLLALFSEVDNADAVMTSSVLQTWRSLRFVLLSSQVESGTAQNL